MKWLSKKERFKEPVWDEVFILFPRLLLDTNHYAMFERVRRVRGWYDPFPGITEGRFVVGYFSLEFKTEEEKANRLTVVK